MFEDSLVESSGKLAVRNPWTTAMSFAMQIMFCGFLMLLSLVYTDTLPSQRLTNALQAPPPPPAAPPIARSVAKVISTATELKDGALVLPREIPKSIVTVRDDAPVTGKAIGIAGDLPGGIPNGTPFGVAEVLRTTEPNVPKLAVQKVRVSSGVVPGLEALYLALGRHDPVLGRAHVAQVGRLLVGDALAGAVQLVGGLPEPLPVVRRGPVHRLLEGFSARRRRRQQDYRGQ